MITRYWSSTTSASMPSGTSRRSGETLIGAPCGSESFSVRCTCATRPGRIETESGTAVGGWSSSGSGITAIFTVEVPVAPKASYTW